MKLTNRNILRHNTNTNKRCVTEECSQQKPQHGTLNQSILKAVFGSLVFLKSDVRNAILACITVLPVLLIS